jgi:putative phosphonate metabolism protein
MRYALYFTPPRDHPLTVACSGWLGRDAFTGAKLAISGRPGLGTAELSNWTAEPRRYGFHATLVAPFRLGSDFGERDVLRAAEAVAGSCAPLAISLEIARLGDFLALVPAPPSAEAEILASSAVDRFDLLRAALTDSEITRRKPERLSERQRAYLLRHGYPYVKEEFRFHMTLTGPVTENEAERIELVLRDIFSPLLTSPIEIDAIAVFVEPEVGAAFTIHSVHRLGAAESRKTA